MIESELTYIGEFSENERGNFCLIRDPRTLLCSLILKLYYSGGIIAKSGNFEIDLSHWGDGTKILGSGFLLAALLIMNNTKLFSQDDNFGFGKNLIPYYFAYESETKLTLVNFMKLRTELFDKLKDPFFLNDDLSITFRLSHYIGDLSHLWKLFLINLYFCAHCIVKYDDETQVLKSKMKERRSTNINVDAEKSENGL